MSNLNNIIVMNRGDSYNLDLTLTDTSSEGRYILQGDDAVYFGLMDPGQQFEFAVVRKKYTVADLDDAGNLCISLRPEDTIGLIPGVYYYAVKLHLDHDELDPETQEPTGAHIDAVVTAIPKTKFFLND